MCQAYDAEFNFITMLEDAATCRGWDAALAGESKDRNPHKTGIYEKQAWDHGWSCGSDAELVPHAVERRDGKAKSTKSLSAARKAKALREVRALGRHK